MTTEVYPTRGETTRGSESMLQDQRPSAQTFGSRPTSNPPSRTHVIRLDSSSTILPKGPRPRAKDGSVIGNAHRSEIRRCNTVRALPVIYFTDLQNPLLERVPMLGRLRHARQAMPAI
jgi:hypothetical protein